MRVGPYADILSGMRRAKRVLCARAVGGVLLISFDRKFGSGTTLMPDQSDYQAFARFEQACSIEYCYFRDATETLGTELVIRPYAPRLFLVSTHKTGEERNN